MPGKVYSWSDVSINQASDIQDICAMKWYGDDRDISKLIELASIITKRPIEEFEAMKISEWSETSGDILDFMATEIPKDMATDRGIWQHPYYELNGTKYMVTTGRDAMTTAQYIDYTTYMSTYPEDIVALMSTILIPEGKDYGKGYDMERAKADIGDYLPITRALGLCFFFTISLRSYVEVTLHYSLKAVKREIRKMKRMKLPTVEMEEKRAAIEEQMQKFGRILQTVSFRQRG